MVFIVFVFVTTGVINAQIATGVWGLHVYHVFSYPGQSWDAATSDMYSNLGSSYYLATITSQPEQDFIYSMMTNNNILGEYWLGGYQDPLETTDPNANWTWVTYEPWSYTNWFPGEPNDNYGPGSEQHLAIWSNDDWKWNDQSYLPNITGYVAETVIPEPGTFLLLGSGFFGLGILGWFRRRKV